VFHPYKHQRLAELGMDLNLARRSSSKLTKTGIRPIRPDGILRKLRRGLLHNAHHRFRVLAHRSGTCSPVAGDLLC